MYMLVTSSGDPCLAVSRDLQIFEGQQKIGPVLATFGQEGSMNYLFLKLFWV